MSNRVITSSRNGVTLTAEIRPTCGVCCALGRDWDKTHDRDLLLEIMNHPHAEPKLKTRVKELRGQGVKVA